MGLNGVEKGKNTEDIESYLRDTPLAWVIALNTLITWGLSHRSARKI